MPPVLAYQHGIYPRSEAIVAATRDLERGRTTREAVDDLFRNERDEIVAIQREAGLDLLSDGLLRWQDIFRPLVDASEGLDARTLVRWFDNNSFFRAPEVQGSPALDGRVPEVLDRDGGLPEPAVLTLPSPYLFSRAAHAEGDRGRLLRELASNVLAPAVRAGISRGARLVHLEDPWLGFFGVEGGTWEALEEGLRSVSDAAGEVPVVLHVYFGDAAPIADRLRALPVSAVGIDFSETDLDALEGGWQTGVLVGCLDGRRSIMEPVDETVRFVRQVADRLDPPAVYVSSNSELELLPREVADGKVRLLGEIAARAKEAIG